MRLFLVGSDNEYAIENFYVKYLKEAGVEVLHFPAQTIFYLYYQQGLINKILFRVGLSTIFKKINDEFKARVHKFAPDIIWIFKGMEIFPESLKWARAQGIKLVNYNGDSPFVFSGRGSGNKNVTGSIGLYDLFLTYSFVDKEKMESQYNVKAKIIPFGFDIDEDLFKQCEQIEEVKKVCFIGNADSPRANFLTSLADNGIEIDIYGDGWNRFIKHRRITVYKAVKNDEFWRTLRKYRIQLNLMRPHNLTTHNMRTFEAAGVGAIQLAPATKDHQLYFKENKEIFLFKDVESCANKIAEIKDLSIQQANLIRRNVRQRSLAAGYSYKKRSAEALSFIKMIH
jgi:spore maturation protein CgeB